MMANPITQHFQELNHRGPADLRLSAIILTSPFSHRECKSDALWS